MKRIAYDLAKDHLIRAKTLGAPMPDVFADKAETSLDHCEMLADLCRDKANRLGLECARVLTGDVIDVDTARKHALTVANLLAAALWLDRHAKNLQQTPDHDA